VSFFGLDLASFTCDGRQQENETNLKVEAQKKRGPSIQASILLVLLKIGKNNMIGAWLNTISNQACMRQIIKRSNGYFSSKELFSMRGFEMKALLVCLFISTALAVEEQPKQPNSCALSFSPSVLASNGAPVTLSWKLDSLPSGAVIGVYAPDTSADNEYLGLVLACFLFSHLRCCVFSDDRITFSLSLSFFPFL
jgi:hypothetical protein